MEICIVVLNYNDSERTTKFINDVKDYKKIAEIVVVDNCSTDNSYEILKKLSSDKITVLKTNENKGYGAGNNFGCKYVIEKYKNPIIFISNPDVVVEEKTFYTMAKYLNDNENIAIVAPNVYQDGQVERGWKLLNPIRGAILNFPFVYRVLRKQENKNYFYNNKHYDTKASIVDVVTGCFFAIKGKIMEQIDFFDENIFLYNEEEILAKKTKKLGYETVVLNDISVIHEHSVSISKSFSNLKKIRIANKSRIYYQKKYNNAGKIDMLFWHIANSISVIKETIKIFFNKLQGGKKHEKR